MFPCYSTDKRARERYEGGRETEERNLRLVTTQYLNRRYKSLQRRNRRQQKKERSCTSVPTERELLWCVARNFRPSDNKNTQMDGYNLSHVAVEHLFYNKKAFDQQSVYSHSLCDRCCTDTVEGCTGRAILNGHKSICSLILFGGGYWCSSCSASAKVFNKLPWSLAALELLSPPVESNGKRQQSFFQDVHKENSQVSRSSRWLGEGLKNFLKDLHEVSFYI